MQAIADICCGGGGGGSNCPTAPAVLGLQEVTFVQLKLLGTPLSHAGYQIELQEGAVGLSHTPAPHTGARACTHVCCSSYTPNHPNLTLFTGYLTAILCCVGNPPSDGPARGYAHSQLCVWHDDGPRSADGPDHLAGTIS